MVIKNNSGCIDGNISILVGYTKSADDEVSYRDKVKGKWWRVDTVGPDYQGTLDTFNMNCVLIENNTFHEMPDFDKEYIHSWAESDYSFDAKRAGRRSVMCNRFIGVCEDENLKGNWKDASLGIGKRLKKESP